VALKAVGWCERECATSVSEIVANNLTDSFVAALSLPTIPSSKVRAALTGEGATAAAAGSGLAAVRAAVASSAEIEAKAEEMGILEPLRVAKAATPEILAKAVEFCDEQGADIDAIKDETMDLLEDFLQALSLKKVPHTRLRSILAGDSDAGSSGSQVTWDPEEPYFYFIPAGTLQACKSMSRMQTLRDEGKLVKMAIKISDAFKGVGTITKVLFVSHRWEMPGMPDGEGVQLTAIQAHLAAHPDIEYIWYDYSCMAQKESEEADGRSAADKQEFGLMLAAIADLYLTSNVLILLDGAYSSRFWTLMEAWCSMMATTAEGVCAATEGQTRYTISTIHTANEHHKKALLELVGSNTPSQMHDVLAKPDIQLTNAKDKKVMLPVVKKTNEHVKQIFARAV